MGLGLKEWQARLDAGEIVQRLVKKQPAPKTLTKLEKRCVRFKVELAEEWGVPISRYLAALMRLPVKG